MDTDSIPLGKTPEKSEYQKLAEHLSVLGLERKVVADAIDSTSYAMVPMTQKRVLQLLLGGQAEIMGALAIFARDYDPDLGVIYSTDQTPALNEDLIFKGGTPEIMAAMHAQMDRMTLDDLRLPEPTAGHRWRLWTGARPSATPGVVEGPAGLPSRRDALIRVWHRNGTVGAPWRHEVRWEHDGGPFDILAYEEPIKTG